MEYGGGGDGGASGCANVDIRLDLSAFILWLLWLPAAALNNLSL